MTRVDARGVAGLALLGLLAALAPSPALADLVACTDLDAGSNAYKVLLDEITYISPEDPVDPQVLEFAMGRLKGKLGMDLEKLRVQDDLRIEVVRCVRRKPRESDFTPDVTETLGRRGVLVELWGDVLSSPDEGCEAIVTYVLIPVRHRDGGDAPAFHEKSYRSELTSPSQRLLDLFEDTIELRAFAAVSAALDRLADGHFNRARELVWQAAGLLRRDRPPDDPLLAYVRRLGLEVVEEARREPDYRGVLRSPAIGACDDAA